MHDIIQAIQVWIGDYGFLGVVGAGIVEEVIAIIPSSIIQGFAGMILFSGVDVTLQNFLSFVWMVGVGSAVGVWLGSLPYMYLTRTLGLSIIDRYGKYIGVQHKDIKFALEKMNAKKWESGMFVALRALPLIPNVTLAIYAGLVKMPFVKYTILTMVGVFIRATVVGLIGWFFGNQVFAFADKVDVIEKVGLIILALLAIAFLVWNYRRKKKTLVVGTK